MQARATDPSFAFVEYDSTDAFRLKRSCFFFDLLKKKVRYHGTALVFPGCSSKSTAAAVDLAWFFKGMTPTGTQHVFFFFLFRLESARLFQGRFFFLSLEECWERGINLARPRTYATHRSDYDRISI